MNFKDYCENILNEGWIETSKTESLKKYLQDVKGIRQKTKLAIEAELRKRQGQRQENNSENGLEITDKNINISEPIENFAGKIIQGTYNNKPIKILISSKNKDTGLIDFDTQPFIMGGPRYKSNTSLKTIIDKFNENIKLNNLQRKQREENEKEMLSKLESVDTVKLDGKIYELTAPITAYKFDGHEASNSYYGSSRIHKSKYKPIQLKVGDRFKVLHQEFYLLEPGKKLSHDDLIKFDNYEKGEFEKNYTPWWKPIPKARKEIK